MYVHERQANPKEVKTHEMEWRGTLFSIYFFRILCFVHLLALLLKLAISLPFPFLCQQKQSLESQEKGKEKGKTFLREECTE